MENKNKFLIREDEFFLISKMIKELTGISLGKRKNNLIISKISSRIMDNNINGIEDYYKFINSRRGNDERIKIISDITTNVTEFFREKKHFNYLDRLLRHDFYREAYSGEEIRIWSSACSSGEEAYSAAMTAVESLSGLPSKTIKILGTDIDPEMIGKARSGIYCKNQAPKIPSEKFNKFCVNNIDTFSMSENIKGLIIFKILNITRDWPFQSKFHAIFCRNVSIYFDKQTTDLLWKRLSSRIHLNGEIYIGHSERIPNSQELGLRPIGTNAYKKVL